MTAPADFSAPVVSGAGRGRRIGTPTFNLALDAVPANLTDGVYACRARLNGASAATAAVLHLGPRPVFRDDRSCEVHLLDGTPPADTTTVAVSDLTYLREVRDFPTKDDLVAQIARDIAQARAILKA